MARQTAPDGVSGHPWRRILLGAAILLAALSLWWLRDVLGVLFWGGLVAYLMSPLVSALTRRGLRRPMAVTVVILVLAGALFLGVRTFAPVAAREVSRLVLQLPGWSRKAEGAALRVSAWRQRLDLPPVVDRALTANVAAAERQMGTAAAQMGRGVFRMVPGIMNIVISPLVAVYLLLDATRLRAGFLQIFTPGFRTHAEELLWRLDGVLGGFLRGQILVAAAVGVMAGLAATLFGLGYGLFIGIVAGVTEVIPYVGPVIGAIPAVLLALTTSPEKALWVALAFFAIHQMEGGLISPAIVGQETGLKPLAVLLALFVGGELAGIPGLVLAVPVAGALVTGVRWAWNVFTVPEAVR